MSAKRSSRNAIVVVIDRLGSGFLGPYGNTWIDTPALNRLASRAILCENLIADSSDLTLLYRSLWTGRHAMDRISITPSDCLAAMARDAGVHTALLADEPAIFAHALADAFQERIALPASTLAEPATSIEETGIGQVCLAAIERMANLTSPTLLWIHGRGMEGIWDAPLELRERFRDEEDPLPYSLTQPPCWELAADHDPDDVLSVLHAFAGHVKVVDTCVGTLLETWHEHQLASETLLIFTSPRGYPLGEHHAIGPSGRELYGEVLRTPLLLQQPNQTAATRLQTLAQPADIFRTLADWFGLDTEENRSAACNILHLANDESAARRDCAFSIGASQRAVTTPAWFLQHDSDGSQELYLKPDDRWEVNEIADRCGDVPSLLVQLIDDFEKLLNSGKLAKLPELPKDLVEGIE